MISAFIFCIYSSSVLAWGTEGHAIVAFLAEKQLERKLDPILTLLKANHLHEVSSWADEIRHVPGWEWTAHLHFSDTPDKSCIFDSNRDCSSEGCIYGALKNFTHHLSQPSRTSDDIKFLIHFVGDAHQPLHVGFTTDRGGNSVRVCANLSHRPDCHNTNLHSVWDDSIIDTWLQDNRTETSPRWIGLANHLLQEMASNEARPRIDKIKENCAVDFNRCFYDMVFESGSLACTAAYQATDNSWIQDGSRLDRPYYEKNLPVALGRLMVASIEALRAQLRNPDHVLISKSDAVIRFALSESDLKLIPFVEKEDPYDSTVSSVKQYALPDIVALAIDKHQTEEAIVKLFEDSIQGQTRTTHTTDGLFGYQTHVEKQPLGFFLSVRRNPPPLLPKIGDIPGLRSVQVGLATNAAIATMKSFVYLATGSSAIFADLSHSLADVLNYSYRWWIVARSSNRPADIYRPYGYSRLRDVCADRSFSVLLGVGGVLPIVHSLMDTTAAGGYAGTVSPLIPLTMFGVSGYLEFVACRAAYKEIQRLSAQSKLSTVEYIRRGRDVMPVATFMEGVSGVFGASVGSIGIGATYMFGSTAFDLVASSLMGFSIIGISSFLLSRSQSNLVGTILPIEKLHRITRLLQSHDTVVAVHDVKSELLGPESVRFKAEIQFNAEAITKKRLSIVSDSTAVQILYDQIHTIKDCHTAEDWLMKNDSAFLLALTKEIKTLEYIVREELRKDGFIFIHVDLEPW